MPQFDASFYFSQLFWLFLCLALLVIVFKKVFIPRMNNIISKRDEYIDRYAKNTESLSCEIKTLEEQINNIKRDEAVKVTEIIQNATKTSSEMVKSQVNALKEENESLINGTRNRLNDELRNMEHASKIDIEVTAKCVFKKIFDQIDEE